MCNVQEDVQRGQTNHYYDKVKSGTKCHGSVDHEAYTSHLYTWHISDTNPF